MSDRCPQCFEPHSGDCLACAWRVADKLRAELLAEKSARLVERRALEHSTCNYVSGCEALKTPPPDVGALVKRLVETLKDEDNHWHRTPQELIGCSACRVLADTEADRKRMGL